MNLSLIDFLKTIENHRKVMERYGKLWKSVGFHVYRPGNGLI